MADFRTSSNGNVVVFPGVYDRKRRNLPPGPTLLLIIEQLQEIVATSHDSLLTEGPVHPDFGLLDLCATALRCWLAHADNRIAVRPFLRQAGKLPAQTGVGIYAKALLVAGSSTGAAGLGRSLAVDLIACDALRNSLIWPDAQREARP